MDLSSGWNGLPTLPPEAGTRVSGGRNGRAGEGELTARVVAAAPEHPAVAAALACRHLDEAARAGRGEEGTLRDELEKGEPFLRRQGAELGEEGGAIDEVDVFLRRVACGLGCEAPRGDHDAFRDLR